jgi:hypothetical protein
MSLVLRFSASRVGSSIPLNQRRWLSGQSSRRRTADNQLTLTRVQAADIDQSTRPADPSSKNQWHAQDHTMDSGPFLDPKLVIREYAPMSTRDIVYPSKPKKESRGCYLEILRAVR